MYERTKFETMPLIQNNGERKSGIIRGYIPGGNVNLLLFIAKCYTNK
jgi:hypothetical protein